MWHASLPGAESPTEGFSEQGLSVCVCVWDRFRCLQKESLTHTHTVPSEERQPQCGRGFSLVGALLAGGLCSPETKHWWGGWRFLRDRKTPAWRPRPRQFSAHWNTKQVLVFQVLPLEGEMQTLFLRDAAWEGEAVRCVCVHECA